MARHVSLSLGIFTLLVFVSLGSAGVSRAKSPQQPELAGSPMDLVNAVNALRASYGLPPYSVDPILMATAQAQADFLALTGTMTHAGPGGIGLTDRLLAAGYPLAGDLALGGFRSENITGGPESMPAETAVQRWMGDAPHLTTMISPDLTEIGAGVSVNNGRVYYVIDCALSTDTGFPQAPPGSPGDALPVPVASPVGIIFPVSMSTPNAEGDLIHEVKPGQSLWQIAIAYDAKIDEIKSLNNRLDNSIFPGEKLLIRKGVLLPTALPTDLSILERSGTVTSLPAPTGTFPDVLPVVTLTPESVSAPGIGDRGVTVKVAMGILALAVIGGIVLAWLGTAKNG